MAKVVRFRRPSLVVSTYILTERSFSLDADRASTLGPMQLLILLCMVILVSKSWSLSSRYANESFPLSLSTVANVSDIEQAVQCVIEQLRPPEPKHILPSASWKIYQDPETITKVFETIKKIGDGSAYTCDDGIPRFRFSGTPTVEITSLVTVTSYLKGSMKQVGDNHWETYKGPTCKISGDASFCATVRSSYHSRITTDGFNRGVDADWNNFYDGPGGWWICPPIDLCGVETGEEVILIYWPPTSSSEDPCARNEIPPPQDGTSRTVVLDAITFQGQDLYSKWQFSSGDTRTLYSRYVGSSILPGPFTFVSPTIYIAHHNITAFAATRVVNVTYMSYTGYSSIQPAGVFPVSASDVYSIRPLGAARRASINYAQQVISGKYSWIDPLPWKTYEYPGETEEMVPLDLTNLPNPVPASVYFDARSDDCWGKHSHCSTITDDSYRPRLAIKARVWSSLLSGWSDCYHGSLVDPPIGLKPLTEQQHQPTITAKPHVPAKETGVQLAKGVYLRPTEAKPGQRIGSEEGGTAKPTAAVRTGHRPHGQPGIFNEGPRADKPDVSPHPFRIDQDGQRGHGLRPHHQSGGWVNDEESEPQNPQDGAHGGRSSSYTPAVKGDGRPKGQTQAVKEGGNLESVRPAVFMGVASNADFPINTAALVGLVILVSCL